MIKEEIRAKLLNEVKKDIGMILNEIEDVKNKKEKLKGEHGKLKSENVNLMVEIENFKLKIKRLKGENVKLTKLQETPLQEICRQYPSQEPRKENLPVIALPRLEEAQEE
jgi:predicted nuclease with TOPRIM domain